MTSPKSISPSDRDRSRRRSLDRFQCPNQRNPAYIYRNVGLRRSFCRRTFPCERHRTEDCLCYRLGYTRRAWTFGGFSKNISRNTSYMNTLDIELQRLLCCKVYVSMCLICHNLIVVMNSNEIICSLSQFHSNLQAAISGELVVIIQAAVAIAATNARLAGTLSFTVTLEVLRSWPIRMVKAEKACRKSKQHLYPSPLWKAELKSSGTRHHMCTWLLYLASSAQADCRSE